MQYHCPLHLAPSYINHEVMSYSGEEPDQRGDSQAGEEALRRRSSRSARYGASCIACRRRKQRCDSKEPVCGRCEKSSEDCIYEGTMRGFHKPHLVSLLLKAYGVLEEVAEGTGVEPPSDLAHEFLRRHPLPLSLKSPGRAANRGSGEGTEFVQQEITGRSIAQQEHKGNRDHHGRIDGRDEIDEMLMQMSLAEDGQNGHFGITSLVWQSPSPALVERLQEGLSRSKQQGGPSDVGVRIDEAAMGDTSNFGEAKGDREIWATSDALEPETEEENALKANSAMIGGWETLAYIKLQLDHGIESSELIVHLLKTFFCWQYGSHCVVYRPVFIRDMALGGSYFNSFLLNVICALSSRYSDYYLGRESDGRTGGRGIETPALGCGMEYLNKAKLLLAAEMDKPSSVPTIQGLLLLGQRECACGNLSQGWQYTGMAFRAMRDLGIHLSSNRLPIFGFGTLSAEDREIRRRLFWSAYSWDKIISLALGRTPTFNAWTNVSPGPIVDDTEDDDEWRPHFYKDQLPADMANYPPQKAHTTLNFRHFVKLCEIIQKIIMRLYSGPPTWEKDLSFFRAMQDKLAGWHSALPAVIKLDASCLPVHCPPPHIFNMNALYRAAVILLHRVFLSNGLPTRTRAPSRTTDEASRICTQMAEELHALFLLHNKSFQLRNITYTLSWSIYSAATVNALDFRSTDGAVSEKAAPRLAMALHVLEKASLHCPGIMRSIGIIKQRLRSPDSYYLKRGIPLANSPVGRAGKRAAAKRTGTTAAEGPTGQTIELADSVLWHELPTNAQDTLEDPSTSTISPERALQLPLHGNVASADFDVSAFFQSTPENNMDLFQSMHAMPTTAATYPSWDWTTWTLNNAT